MTELRSRRRPKRQLWRIWLLLALAIGPACTPALAEGSPKSWLGLPAPEGFIPPFLDPTGIDLRTERLSEGVYALVAGQGAADNSGFVVGSRGVLVIDSHINAAMAQQIIGAVAEVTTKPILYLVNTNYHGDHTFGNYAFPEKTSIVVHAETARQMMDLDLEKELMLPTVRGNRAIYENVKRRSPDIVFERFLSIDLGGQSVEIHHFGGGNTSGDTVVYVPSASVAWTGNLVVGSGTIPPLFEGRPKRYLATIRKLQETIDVDTIVPGHGGLAAGPHLGRYIGYMESLVHDLEQAAAENLSVDDALERLPLDRYLTFPQGTPESFMAYINGLHRLNVHRSHLQRVGAKNE